MKLSLILIGGGMGALLRYAFSRMLAFNNVEGGFPWGTVIVNLAGCFLMGFLWQMGEKMNFSNEIKMLLFIGFLGGFTTFSTFALDSFNLLKSGKTLLFLMNLLISNFLGILFLVLGFYISLKIDNIYKVP